MWTTSCPKRPLLCKNDQPNLGNYPECNPHDTYKNPMLSDMIGLSSAR
jgi:hypothetical protein